MLSDGALKLSDIRVPMVHIVCADCNCQSSYRIAALVKEYGDAELSELLLKLSACSKACSAGANNGCKAVFERLVCEHRR